MAINVYALVTADWHDCAKMADIKQSAMVRDIVVMTLDGFGPMQDGVPGAKKAATWSFYQTAVNNSITYSEELNYAEGERSAMKVSIVATLPIKSTHHTKAEALGFVDASHNNLGFIVAVRFVTGRTILVGGRGSLEVTAASVDSTTDGYVHATLATPDWKSGSSVEPISEATFEAFKAAAL